MRNISSKSIYHFPFVRLGMPILTVASSQPRLLITVFEFLRSSGLVTVWEFIIGLISVIDWDHFLKILISDDIRSKLPTVDCAFISVNDKAV